ncbi:MAG TPA: hypothetical protein PLI09_12455 [Candidatus Hydrogenedentes bacterium]|nr:hypothetical protein [Candidatus Hydrogenedentota bacterium]
MFSYRVSTLALCVLIFSAITATASTYRVYSGAPNSGLEWTTINGAFAAAVAAGGDHTIQIEYAGPFLDLDGQYFSEPMMELIDSGNITLQTTSGAGTKPTVRTDGDHPLFRVNSTVGKILTVNGANTDGITFYSAYAKPLLDCGDPTQPGGLGNGLVALQNVIISKAMWIEGPPEQPGAPNGVFLKIDNRAVAIHTLTNVQFFGGNAKNPSDLPNFQTDPALKTGAYHGDTILHLNMTNVNFTTVMGHGVRLNIQNNAIINAYNCYFAPQGGINSENAPALIAESSAMIDGGSRITFDHCFFQCGNNTPGLFAKLGEHWHVTPNEYTLIEPVFTGQCGSASSAAFQIDNSGATVHIIGENESNRTNLDPIIATGTGAYAFIQKGSFILDYCKGSVKPSIGAIQSLGTLSGNISVEMNSCVWENGAGAFRCSASGYSPHFKAVNTMFRGGDCLTYIDVSGGSRPPAILELQHCTLASPAATPVTDCLVKGNAGDTFYAAATLFDANGADGRASASNLTPTLKSGMAWKNLAWDADASYGGFPSDPGAACIIADPHLDPATAKLTNQSFPAMGAATTSDLPDSTPYDFEHDARPLPIAGVNIPDIGADEAQFGPTGVQWTTPPDIPGIVGDSDSPGTLVGSLEAIDPDPGDTHTFEITNQYGNWPGDPDNHFELSGNQVVVKTGHDPFSIGVCTIYIKAIDSSGNVLSPPAANTTLTVTVIDSTPPYVTRVQVASAYSVEVEFSEAMGAGAALKENYTLSGSGQGTLAATPASVTAISDTIFLLNWAVGSGEMVKGGDITITVDASVTDVTNNPLGSPNSGTDAGNGVGILPILASIDVMTLNTIKAVFSEPMRSPETLIAANYALSGAGMGTLAPSPTAVSFISGSSYLLEWATGETTQAPGDIVTITVTGVYDLAGNPIDTAGGNNIKSDTVLTSPPNLINMEAITDHSINLTFSELMSNEPGESNRITNPANYSLANIGMSGGMGTISSPTPDTVVQVGATPVYTLVWNLGEMLQGGLIKVTVDAAVEDLDGNAIANRVAYGEGKGTPPRVSQVIISDRNHIKVIYSEAMSPGVLSRYKYELSGPGQGTLSQTPSAVASLGDNTYRLTWNTGQLALGQDITIVVLNSDVKDLAGNPIGDVYNRGVVHNRIAVTQDPEDAMMYVSESHSMTLQISGGLPGQVVYQWVKIGAKDQIVGTGPTLEFISLKLSDSGGYRCDVSDGREEIVGSAVASLSVANPMHIDRQPVGGEVFKGGSFTLSVHVAEGLPPYHYHWKCKGENVGYNSYSYYISDMAEEDAGDYYVEVSDQRTTIPSDHVEVTMLIQEIPVAGVCALAALIAAIGSLGMFRLYRGTQVQSIKTRK